MLFGCCASLVDLGDAEIGVDTSLTHPHRQPACGGSACDHSDAHRLRARRRVEVGVISPMRHAPDQASAPLVEDDDR